MKPNTEILNRSQWAVLINTGTTLLGMCHEIIQLCNGQHLPVEMVRICLMVDIDALS